MSATLVSVWTDVRRRLEAAGIDTPVIDARLLLEAGANVSRLDIITDPRRALSEEQVTAVNVLAARRETREPISHILGTKGFWTYQFEVNADVLTPRPETELLVKLALDALPSDSGARVLDLGVGSGAILLSILAEREKVTGVGVDASEAALQVARANARKLGVDARVELQTGDWCQGLSGQFEVVLSNPPYIPSGDIAGLAPEVSRYEPHLALDGGADGLDAYRTIIAALPSLLTATGMFALEVGIGQAEAVRAMALAEGFEVAEPHLDIGGVHRVISGKRAASG